MNTSPPRSDVAVRLTLASHHQAEQFRRRQSSSQKAKQVYLNTLAIYAVQFYLECAGYDIDGPASAGLNPVQQMLLGTAALAVTGYGQLECCPVLPGETEVAIAPELHQDRLAYVAVQLDDSLRTATLLGFTTKAANSVALDQLQPMDHLSSLLVPTLAQQMDDRITQLSQWLQDIADDGWERLDTLLNPRTPAFRSQAAEIQPMTGNQNVIRRSKRISLNNNDITLEIGLLPLADDQVTIQVQVCATQPQTYLPPQLRLSVLDTDNQEVMQAEARATEAIQLRLTGNPGEQFSLKLTLQETSFAERFVI